MSTGKSKLTAQDIHDALDDIEQADPVGELAAVLIGTGWSPKDLQSALGERLRSPIGCELVNKYRDITIGGWTDTFYRKRRIWRQT